MDENKERNLKVIDNTKTDEKITAKPEKVRQTNPIARKLLEFHHENMKKFSVIDLFKP